MTPQLRQAIKLLQFNNLEAAAFVEEELERNPLLERDERSDAPMLERPALDQPEKPGVRERRLLPTSWAAGNVARGGRRAPLDTEWPTDTRRMARRMAYACPAGAGSTSSFDTDDRDLADLVESA